MLSQKRIDLIRENLPKVLLLSDGEETGCQYLYPSGKMCIASAAFTDEERLKVVVNNNGTFVQNDEIRELIPDLTDSEIETLAWLQDLHDSGSSAYASESEKVEYKQKLQQAVDELLND